MKMLLSFILLSSTISQAAVIDHFRYFRDGGGDIAFLVKDTSAGLKIKITRCNFHPVPYNKEAFIKGRSTLLFTKRIMKGTASILSDMSPETHVVQTGTWVSLSYDLENEKYDVPNPVILYSGKVSDVLDSLEDQARKLCI